MYIYIYIDIYIYISNTKVAKSEHLSPLEKSVMALSEGLQQIQAEQVCLCLRVLAIAHMACCSCALFSCACVWMCVSIYT